MMLKLMGLLKRAMAKPLPVIAFRFAQTLQLQWMAQTGAWARLARRAEQLGKVERWSLLEGEDLDSALKAYPAAAGALRACESSGLLDGWGQQTAAGRTPGLCAAAMPCCCWRADVQRRAHCACWPAPC